MTSVPNHHIGTEVVILILIVSFTSCVNLSRYFPFPQQIGLFDLLYYFK